MTAAQPGPGGRDVAARDDPSPIAAGSAERRADTPRTDRAGVELSLPGTARTYLWVGIGTAVALTAVFLGIAIATLVYDASVAGWVERSFDMDGEAAVPAWYSGAQMLLAAIAFSTVGRRYTGRTRRDFNIAAGAMLLASLDEVVAVHEVIAKRLNRLMDAGPPFGRAWWVVPGTMVAATLALVLRRLLGALGPRSARLVVIGTAVFLLGALGLESISSKFEFETVGRSLQVAFEEIAEMLGATIVVFALLLEIADGPRPLRSRDACAGRPPIPETGEPQVPSPPT